MKKLIIGLAIILVSIAGQAQSHWVAGNIIDTNQVPVSNATVLAIKSGKSTTADYMGYFSLRDVMGNDSLKITFGSEEMFVPIQYRNQIIITFNPGMEYGLSLNVQGQIGEQQEMLEKMNEELPQMMQKLEKLEEIPAELDRYDIVYSQREIKSLEKNELKEEFEPAEEMFKKMEKLEPLYDVIEELPAGTYNVVVADQAITPPPLNSIPNPEEDIEVLFEDVYYETGEEEVFGMADEAVTLDWDKDGIADELDKKMDIEPIDIEEPKVIENSFVLTENDNQSTFSVDVDHGSYTLVEEYITQYGVTPAKDQIRIEEMVNYFDYDYPDPKGKTPFSIYTEVAECPWNPEHQLLHIGLKGKELAVDEIPSSNLVFLIDVSGSMDDANKLDLVKTSLGLLVDQLREEDRVAIVTYSDFITLALPGTPGSEKEKIKQVINSLYADGSTNGGEGIQLAYKTAEENFISGGNNRIIIATDGDFNVGLSTIEEMETLVTEKRQSGVFLTALGFGMNNYKDETLETLADFGNGNYAYINDEDEANKVFIEEFAQNMYTIAKDVKIQMHFNPENVEAFRLIGFDNRRLDHIDFTDDTKDAGEINAGHTMTAMYEIIPKGSESSYLKAANEIEANINGKTSDPKEALHGLAEIKLRYKAPDADVSQEFSHTVHKLSIEKSSNDFRFAAAVAMFGLLLQESDYVQNADYEMVRTMAKSSIGKDKKGLRKDFVMLVEQRINL